MVSNNQICQVFFKYITYNIINVLGVLFAKFF